MLPCLYTQERKAVSHIHDFFSFFAETDNNCYRLAKFDKIEQHAAFSYFQRNRENKIAIKVATDFAQNIYKMLKETYATLWILT